jgi:hypothetical protein
VLIKLLFNSGYIKPHIHLGAGETHDVPEELARELLKHGRAVIPKKPKIETTEANPMENAARRVGRPPKNE